MITFRGAALAALFVFTTGVAQGQSYPSKPVRIVLGFPPATTVDVLVRPLAQKLSEKFGQQFLVDNRPGATGNSASSSWSTTGPALQG
jgi:tripartite-type tricarboxylate transporter receptor subunit TctC